MNAPSNQIMVFKYHFHWKKNRANWAEDWLVNQGILSVGNLLEEQLIPSQETYKRGLGHLDVARKKTIKD